MLMSAVSADIILVVVQSQTAITQVQLQVMIMSAVSAEIIMTQSKTAIPLIQQQVKAYSEKSAATPEYAQNCEIGDAFKYEKTEILFLYLFLSERNKRI